MRDQPESAYWPARKAGELARVDPRVVVLGVGRGLRHPVAQPVADRGELAVGELEQSGGEGEAAVEVGDVLVGDGALVADVVLELGPRVLQHGPDLDLRLTPAQQLEAVLAFAHRIQADEQVAAGVAEPTLTRRLLAHVAIVVDHDLVREQVGDGLDVAVHVGDHPHADLVGDVPQRVGEHRPAVGDAGGLGRERRHGLRATGHGQVVDAGLVEGGGHHGDVLVGGQPQVGVVLGVLPHGGTRVKRYGGARPPGGATASAGSVGVTM